MYLMSDLWSSRWGNVWVSGVWSVRTHGRAGPAWTRVPGPRHKPVSIPDTRPGEPRFLQPQEWAPSKKQWIFSQGSTCRSNLEKKTRRKKIEKETFEHLSSFYLLITHNTIYFFYEIFVPGAGAGMFKLTAVTDTRSDGVSDAAEEMIFIFKF